MNYFKSTLVGISTVVLGCVVTVISMMIWFFWKASSNARPGPGEQWAASFSFRGLWDLPSRSAGFWLFVIALFAVGFLISQCLQRR